MAHSKKPLIIGIGGVTCGGKTWLSNKLRETLSTDYQVAIINQDDYFLEPSSLFLIPELNYPLYDVVEAVDMEAIMRKILTLSADVIIIEGNLIFKHAPLQTLLNLRFFLTLSYDECERIRQTRVYDPPDVPGYFSSYVWPSFISHELEMRSSTHPITFLHGLAYDSNFSQIHISVRRSLSSDWISISAHPLSLTDAYNFVSDASCGAISTFVGTTRNTFEGKQVLQLEYESYIPMAKQKLSSLCASIRVKWPTIFHIAIFHRLGVVPISESSVIISISSPHRKDAQQASSFAIDELKASVPIWKRRYIPMAVMSGRRIRNSFGVDNTEFTPLLNLRTISFVLLTMCDRSDFHV